MTEHYSLDIRPTPDGVLIALRCERADGEPVEIGVVVDPATAREISGRIAAAAGDAFHRTAGQHGTSPASA